MPGELAVEVPEELEPLEDELLPFELAELPAVPVWPGALAELPALPVCPGAVEVPLPGTPCPLPCPPAFEFAGGPVAPSEPFGVAVAVPELPPWGARPFPPPLALGPAFAPPWEWWPWRLLWECAAPEPRAWPWPAPGLDAEPVPLAAPADGRDPSVALDGAADELLAGAESWCSGSGR